MGMTKLLNVMVKSPHTMILAEGWRISVLSQPQNKMTKMANNTKYENIYKTRFHPQEYSL